MNSEDPRSLRERLASEIGPCLASDLMAHIQRGGVIVVAAELILLDVAVAVAEDDVVRVQGWIAAERLRHPSNEQIKAWEKSPDARFVSVIVRPYVLIQESGGPQD